LDDLYRAGQLEFYEGITFVYSNTVGQALQGVVTGMVDREIIRPGEAITIMLDIERRLNR